MESKQIFKEVSDMTTAMRWRVVVLQVGLIGILAFCAGFLFWGNSFIHNQISTELTSQQIYFPPSDNRRAGPGLCEPLHRRPSTGNRRRPDLLSGEHQGAGKSDGCEAGRPGADALPR